jgi:hypothetical protein
MMECPRPFFLTFCWCHLSTEPGKHDGLLMHEKIPRKFDLSLYRFKGTILSLF